MKGLQWTKIPYAKMKGTIFEEFPESSPITNNINFFSAFKGEIEYDEIEKLFAAKVIEKKEKSTEFSYLFLIYPRERRNQDSSHFGTQSRSELMYTI